MKIRENENLNVLFESSNLKDLTISNFQEKIISELISRGIVNDDPVNYGVKIRDSWARDINLSEIIEVFHAIGIPVVNSRLVDALHECELLGDGGCPYCGGFCDVVDWETRDLPSGDYDLPDDYELLSETFQCVECGYKWKEDY